MTALLSHNYLRPMSQPQFAMIASSSWCTDSWTRWSASWNRRRGRSGRWSGVRSPSRGGWGGRRGCHSRRTRRSSTSPSSPTTANATTSSRIAPGSRMTSTWRSRPGATTPKRRRWTTTRRRRCTVNKQGRQTRTTRRGGTYESKWAVL